jgi:ElaB/YqjD/DUF883 family membrane-anchored ribosome-binding protein
MTNVEGLHLRRRPTHTDPQVVRMLSTSRGMISTSRVPRHCADPRQASTASLRCRRKRTTSFELRGEKGQEAIDNVRDVGDALGTAVEKSVTARPYTTLALAVAGGFLLGATWPC